MQQPDEASTLAKKLFILTMLGVVAYGAVAYALVN
jgi:hypothetical protein